MAMSLKELENEVKALKKQVAENARARDYLEIWKLQSLYSHLYHIGRNSDVPSLFAQKTPGVVMEIEDSGVYEGLNSVTYFWNEVFNADRMQRTPGFLAIHMTVNPVIEINKKGNRSTICRPRFIKTRPVRNEPNQHHVQSSSTSRGPDFCPAPYFILSSICLFRLHR